MEQKAGIQFKGYRIVKSHIDIKDDTVEGLNISFQPKGEIDNSKNIFSLLLGVDIKDKDNKFNTEVEIIGEFHFNNREDENIDTFLYLNAPAIIFPYIRSYISTLTTLSGVKAIVLPTLNLSGLAQQLKKNTKEIN